MNYRIAVIALAGALLMDVVQVRPCSAADAQCCLCGQERECRTVCRLVPEEQKISKTCWGCKSEDFCLPGPSRRGCKHSEDVCGDGDACCFPCLWSKNLVWFDWRPGCSGSVHTRNKLMKRTVTKTVPGFKWVVEDVCATCEHAASAACESEDTGAAALP